MFFFLKLIGFNLCLMIQNIIKFTHNSKWDLLLVKKQLALLIVPLTYECVKIWALSQYYYSDGNKQNHYFQIWCKYYRLSKAVKLVSIFMKKKFKHYL